MPASGASSTTSESASRGARTGAMKLGAAGRQQAREPAASAEPPRGAAAPTDDAKDEEAGWGSGSDEVRSGV